MASILKKGATTPVITIELIEWLQGLYPDSVLALRNGDQQDVHWAQGQQMVIAKLRSEFNKQNDKPDDEDE